MLDFLKEMIEDTFKAIAWIIIIAGLLVISMAGGI